MTILKRYPLKFRGDVVTVARRGDLTLAEVAADFNVFAKSVCGWLREADIEDGIIDVVKFTEQSGMTRLGRG